MQTRHKTLHKPRISLIFRTLRNVGFIFQTLHKSYTRTYTNPTQKRSKTIHTPNILVLNTKRAKCSEINETFNETINGH